VKSVVWLSCECAACIHVYLSGEIRMGDNAPLVGVCKPIMHFPMMFHGEVGGTREPFGPWRGVESLFGSPSSITVRRRSLCARRGGQAGEEGEVWPRVTSLGFGAGEVEARLLFRVGACADELR
jgi:hypothetical protein